MTAGAAVLPEGPPRRTHPDSYDRGSGDDSGKNDIGGGSSTDRENDLRRQWQSPSPLLPLWGCDGRRDDDDSGKRGGEVMVRRWRGNYKATVRRLLQGNNEATRMQRQSAMVPQVAGARRQ